MKLILSPTKTMAFDIPETGMPSGPPAFGAQAFELNRMLAGLDKDEIQALYKTSDSLTRKTMEQIRGFERASEGPALFVFRGEAFKTLDPVRFDRKDLGFAQDHLRILSGLYGLLRPMDRIRPYRLDLATPLKPGGKGLKAFWKQHLVPWFEKELAPDEAILNLASEEYAALFRGSPLAERMVTLQFRQRQGETVKNNSVRAKQARGLFSREVIRNRIQEPQKVKALCPEGYRFSKALSSETRWVFIC